MLLYKYHNQDYITLISISQVDLELSHVKKDFLMSWVAYFSYKCYIYNIGNYSTIILKVIKLLLSLLYNDFIEWGSLYSFYQSSQLSNGYKIPLSFDPLST